MREWKSLLGVILVFVLGGLAGAFLSLSLVHHRVTVLLQRGSPAYEQLLERRLTRGLDLDADQRERLHQALMDNISQRREIQRQLQPQMQALNRQTGLQIREILHPDQLATFRHNLSDFHKHFGGPGLGGSREFKADAEPESSDLGSTNGPPDNG